MQSAKTLGVREELRTAEALNGAENGANEADDQLTVEAVDEDKDFYLSDSPGPKAPRFRLSQQFAGAVLSILTAAATGPTLLAACGGEIDHMNTPGMKAVDKGSAEKEKARAEYNENAGVAARSNPNNKNYNLDRGHDRDSKSEIVPTSDVEQVKSLARWLIKMGQHGIAATLVVGLCIMTPYLTALLIPGIFFGKWESFVESSIAVGLGLALAGAASTLGIGFLPWVCLVVPGIVMFVRNKEAGKLAIFGAGTAAGVGILSIDWLRQLLDSLLN